jgi:hypothetical protein
MTASRKSNRTMGERRSHAVRRAPDPVAAGARAKPTAGSASEAALADSLSEARDYAADLWERTILFWDTLRQRADNMLEHERAGLPPLIDFKYETILDARHTEPRRRPGPAPRPDRSAGAGPAADGGRPPGRAWR